MRKNVCVQLSSDRKTVPTVPVFSVSGKAVSWAILKRFDGGGGGIGMEGGGVVFWYSESCGLWVGSVLNFGFFCYVFWA